MHMADALLSPAVGLTFCAVSAGAIAVTASKIKRDQLEEKSIPVMGVMGAFVFAAQMINFTIPGTGSSGHIGGGILLAALLGGGPAFLALAAVLIIQCLFFADGGLLALGCNLFNMGILPCLVVYPLLYKPIIRRMRNAKGLTLASILAVVAGLQLGAFAVVLQTTASGVTALPFGTFVLLMQPIHLAIGLIEGLITAAVLIFIYRARPELLDDFGETHAPSGLPARRVVAILAVAALLIGGGLSLFASSNPDGLEWAIEHTAGGTELTSDEALHAKAADIQEKTALMPDYAFASGEGGTPTAGIVGGLLTCALAVTAGFVLSAVKKRKMTKS